jgi:hypothetical protein
MRLGLHGFSQGSVAPSCRGQLIGLSKYAPAGQRTHVSPGLQQVNKAFKVPCLSVRDAYTICTFTTSVALPLPPPLSLSTCQTDLLHASQSVNAPTTEKKNLPLCPTNERQNEVQRSPPQPGRYSLPGTSNAGCRRGLRQCRIPDKIAPTSHKH